jgi:alpha-N-acetylglucosamine transferase
MGEGSPHELGSHSFLQLWLLNKLSLRGLFTVVNHGTINDIRANSTLVVLHFLSQ